MNPRHVAPLFVLALAFACASERKQSEPMQPASYEGPPAPNATSEPKGLPPNAPPDQGPMSPDTPEGAGNLQKEQPGAPPPAAGGSSGASGGMGGMGGMEPVAGRSGIGGTRSIGDAGAR